ncbi:NAD(P)-dependent alcohol dehydrogenase [Maribacter sp. 2308TA10-17]|uniref:NAD(P)-dependent alcohol dehydrogenase n=1 Tax=Maribacter sp. 2308TA10-17 TaxID=3386276 RepID=UPI0039BC7B6A
MKAITRTKYGPPEVLEVKEIPKPVPNDNELLVRVHATAVNRTDCGILTGKPYLIRAFVGLTKPRHLVPGTDFAGIVEVIGKNVSDFKVGDRVWGLHDEGLQSQAEYMTIRAIRSAAKIPEGFSFQEVVACAEGAHYANNFINKVKIDSNTKVLVNGATGAIGSAAIQLLKYYGATVTAVGNTKNMDLVKSLGPDKTIDYQKEDFTKDDEKYHFIFDAVGKSSFPKCKHLLLPKGVYISSELGPNAQNLYLPLITKIKGGKRVIFPFPVNCKKSIVFMSKLLSEGKFKPVIDKVYQPEQIVEAYNYVTSGQKTGNVIVNFSPTKA